MAEFRKKTIQDVDFTGKTVLVRVDYNVPIKDWGTTFYTRFGDIFARLNALITLSALAWLSHRWLQHKKALLKAVEPNTKASSNVTKKYPKKS